MKITCVAIDDEPLALEKITGFIRQINYLELLASFSNPLEALAFLKGSSVDLLFLDIQMDELTGIELIEVLNPKSGIILTTAHSEYALKGYELRVHDYLLKPYSFQRFLRAVDSFENLSHLDDGKQADYSAPIFVKSGTVWKNIQINQILYVEGMKDYLCIWTPEGRVVTLMSFSRIQEMLPVSHFARIHRSYLVSLDKILEISKNRVRIGDRYLPIGEAYKQDFFRRLG